MKFYYYVDKEGVRQGPLPLEDLTSEDISPRTLVWAKGMEKWMRAKDVSDFSELLKKQEEEIKGAQNPTQKAPEVSESQTNNAEEKLSKDVVEPHDTKDSWFFY